MSYLERPKKHGAIGKAHRQGDCRLAFQRRALAQRRDNPGSRILPGDTAKPIEPGQVAPDFKLKKLDGSSTLQLSSMSGRVVVLSTGL